MSIVVEDGSVVGGANSYVTRAEANAFFALIDDTGWADADDAKKMLP